MRPNYPFNSKPLGTQLAAGGTYLRLRRIPCYQQKRVDLEGEVLNKDIWSMQADVYQYLLNHTRESATLRELRESSSGTGGARMQTAPEQGQLLGILVELIQPRKAIEIGVFTGYSSIAIAQALPDGAMLACLDRDPKSMATAQEFFHKAGIEDKVECYLGDATSSLDTLLAEWGPNTVDFVYIDADKRSQESYFTKCLSLVRPGGLIAVDNVLWYGRVADSQVEDKTTVAIRDFNQKRLNDDRISFTIVPVADGLALCRKK